MACVLAVAANGAALTTARVIAQTTFADTRAIVEFQRAADSYAFLHRQVERQIGFAHGRSRSGASIEASELAAAIRAERRKVDSGGLFTPAVAAAFRDAAGRAVRAGCDAGELRTGVSKTAHAPNSPATNTNPIAPCLAGVLPRLPDELEYRSAGTVLLLVDAHADLVVDVLPALLAG
jgi:hypothetical protein